MTFLGKEGKRDINPLDRFLVDGLLFALMLSFGETFFPAYAVYLGFSGVAMSYLFAFPRLISSVGNLLANFLLHRFSSRRSIVTFMVLMQSISWILVLLCGILQANFFVLLLVFTFYYFMGSLSSPIWYSWLGHFLSPGKSGDFFGLRNRVLNLTMFFSFLGSSFLIQFLTGKSVFGLDGEMFAYGIFFLIAFASRFYDFLNLKKIEDVSLSFSYEEKISLKETIFPKKHLNKEFIILTLFSSLFMFSVFIAVPFFPEYMLNYLDFSYLHYVAFSMVAVLLKFITSQAIGRLGDLHGHARLFVLGSFIIANFSFIWFLSESFLLLIIFDTFVAFGWAIWDIFSITLLYEFSPKERRTFLIAWYNSVLIFGAFFGSLVSGFIFSALNGCCENPYHIIFLVSSLLRLGLVLGFCFFLKDIRSFAPISHPRLVLRVLHILPGEGIRFVPVSIRRIHEKIKLKPYKNRKT
jgi:MFS family permease